MSDENLVSITGGPLKPHEYVLVKADMTAGDEAWIQDHAAKQRGSSKKDAEVVFTIGAVKLATVQRLVKGWSISVERTRADGVTERVPFPFSTQNVEHLPGRIYRHILKEIDKMNPDEDDEGDAAFLPDVVDSSEDTWEAERTFRLKA